MFESCRDRQFFSCLFASRGASVTLGMTMPRTITNKFMDKPDTAIDEIVSRCGGDIRGAIP
jgi:hypothetical protein